MTKQEAELRRFIETLGQMTEAQERPENAEIVPGHFNVGGWTIYIDSVLGFLDDQGMIIHDLMISVPDDFRLGVISEVGQLIVGFIDGVSRIFSLRDFENKPIEDDFPSVLPQSLAKLQGIDFLPLLQTYRERFANSLNQIATEQIQLFKAYQTEPSLQTAFDQVNDHSFEKNWDIVKGRFYKLRSFSGALLTVFPNTASVESEFSVLGWEKDEHRESLSNISLEGILHNERFFVRERVAVCLHYLTTCDSIAHSSNLFDMGKSPAYRFIEEVIHVFVMEL